ncbi:hypothetical protein [Myxococcus xanthus]|uniref:hypothetical protein n=1 Tax=Myxococcus xanthus TaxID=34 RepID=UPI0011274855|nr:hypothetical protein [Myxococcus xanthus]QDF00701.1 hypothetical protein BHS05_35460 [Myxococcus xanthus]
MSDRPGMSALVSHSTSNSSSTRVLEQRNLLGGMDLLPVLGGKGRKRARRFHVASERRVGFAAALALVVEHGKQKAKETGVTYLSTCPRCGHRGPTAQDFGYRIMRGERRPQSWCRGCRGLHLEPTETARTSNSAPRGTDGWLFPPESTTSTRPPRRGNGSSTQHRATGSSTDSPPSR